MAASLLSTEQIKYIISDSVNPEYKEENLIHPAFNNLHIMQVSKDTNLILFYGNNETGFIHIQKFHSADSLIVEFKNDKASSKTKFNNNLIPIFHYLKIADSIYKTENLNIEKNTNPEFFDLYLGTSNIGGIDIRYKLLLYKGTKIIHNLHPLNQPDKTKLHSGKNARGAVNYNYSLDDETHRIEIPYYNSDKVITFKIIIEHFNNKRKIRICKIQDNQVLIEKILQIEKIEIEVSPLIMFLYQYADLSNYETLFYKL
ncbi:MAG: hypothetical protein AB7E26_02590 [Chryseobacterium sp.]